VHRRGHRGPRGVVAASVVALVSVVAACGDDRGSADAPRTGPLTPLDPERIPEAQRTAVERLGAAADPDVPGAHGGHDGHGAGHGDHAGPVTTVELPAGDRPTFDAQWAAARAAAGALATVADAEAAGYVQSAAPGPGVGAHFVDWTLVDAPFDPARPAMLLYDLDAPGRPLVGFSYWLLSDAAPEGFAGPNDEWHQHTGLCVVNGWVDREMSSGSEGCAGTYLGGADLWMLHAWVVPGHENRWGDFAVFNPALCPSNADTPDVLRCPSEPAL
jgi:hypothetical protein